MNTIFSENLTAKEITQIIVQRHKGNQKYRDIIQADKYYGADNVEIEKKTRVYYDKDEKPHDNPNSYNSKISSSFLRNLVQQKQDYGFAKTFTLKIMKDDKEVKDSEYEKQWNKFLDDILYKKSYTLSGQAVNHGIAWGYVWIDENGDLKIDDVASEIVYPEWSDKGHTILDKLVYNYSTETYESLSPTLTEYAELWTDEERRLFIVSDGYNEKAILTDNDGNLIPQHMIKGENPISWGKIPFIALKGTDDEKPLLKFIKEHIDAYDYLGSRSADGLIDDLDPLLVLKGISAEVSSLIEARELAKMTRTISLDTDGDASYIQSKTDIDSNLKMKQDLRRDIIKFGYGVDFEDARFGGNPNQLVIKSLYQNLDTYTDGLERHFQDFIDDLKYFFDKYLEWKNKSSEDYKDMRVLIKLDRSMIINQSSLIEDTVKLAGTGISQKTLLEYNPVVQDVKLEESRIEEEKKKAEEENPLFNFPLNETNDETIVEEEEK